MAQTDDGSYLTRDECDKMAQSAIDLGRKVTEAFRKIPGLSQAIHKAFFECQPTAVKRTAQSFPEQVQTAKKSVAALGLSLEPLFAFCESDNQADCRLKQVDPCEGTFKVLDSTPTTLTVGEVGTSENDYENQSIHDQADAILDYLLSEEDQCVVPPGRVKLLERSLRGDLKRQNCQPYLGFATTQELLDEIESRIAIDSASGGCGLDYTPYFGKGVFEVGKYYQHSGGGKVMKIIGRIQTRMWGHCLLGEEGDGTLTPVGTDAAAFTGWSEFDYENE